MESTHNPIPKKKRKTAVKAVQSNPHPAKNLLDAYQLPESLSMRSVEAIAAELRDIDLTRANLGINASATRAITTSGIQLLLSYDAMLKSVGSALRLHHAHEELAAPFRLLGLESIWQEWTQSPTPDNRSEA